MSNYFHTPMRDLHENNMVDGDDPEVDTGNASCDRKTNIMPETEEETWKNTLQRTRQGIFTRGSPSIFPFSNPLQLRSNSWTVKRLGLLDYKSTAMKCKKLSVARPVSLLHDAKFPSYPLLVPRRSSHHPLLLLPTSTLPHVPASAFLSAFPARARDNVLMSAIAVDPNVKGRAFPPPAIPYHHHSASDGFFKKVRMQKYLKKEERDTGSYEGAMNSTRDGRESGGHDFNPPAGLPISAARVPHLRPLMASPRQVCLTLAFVFSCRALGWGSEQSVPVKTDFTPFRKYRQRRTNPTRTFRFSKVRPSTQSTPPLRTVASH